MQLSDDEIDRENRQRWESDAWMQIKAAEIQQRNSTIAVLCTIIALILAGSWWLAEKAADEKVGPVSERVGIAEAKIEHINKKFDRVEVKLDKILDLVIESRK
jgi:hypothetical protein